MGGFGRCVMASAAQGTSMVRRRKAHRMFTRYQPRPLGFLAVEPVAGRATGRGGGLPGRFRRGGTPDKEPCSFRAVEQPRRRGKAMRLDDLEIPATSACRAALEVAA